MPTVIKNNTGLNNDNTNSNTQIYPIIKPIVISTINLIIVEKRNFLCILKIYNKV
jgi:hypothetical protein